MSMRINSLAETMYTAALMGTPSTLICTVPRPLASKGGLLVTVPLNVAWLWLPKSLMSSIPLLIVPPLI